MRRFCDYEVGDTFRFRDFNFAVTAPGSACPTNIGRGEGMDSVLHYVARFGRLPTFRPAQWLCEF